MWYSSWRFEVEYEMSSFDMLPDGTEELRGEVVNIGVPVLFENQSPLR
jgi:hypothetical protein